MRITDASDGSNLGTAYSYWPTFNKDNTKILAISGGSGLIFNFNPVTFQLGSKIAAPAGILSYEHAVKWSALNPDLMYGVNGALVRRLSVAVGSWTTIRDLSTRFPSKYFAQISLSSNDDVIAFIVKNQSDSSVAGYAAYKISTDTVLYNVATTQLDEVQVDKSGRFLVVKTGLQGAGAIEVRIIDLLASPTPTVVNLTDNGPDFAPGHSDNGTGVVSGADNWDNSITFRNLITPHVSTQIFSFGNDWSNDYHISQLGDNEGWLLVSDFSAVTNSPFNNEIFLVKTDGSGAVVRFLHHYSFHGDYWSTPRANISKDGKFVAFTSNWGVAGRSDLFVARIPDGTLPGPSPTPTPSPSPTPAPTPSPSPTPGGPNGNASFENVVGFIPQAGVLQKSMTPYYASADTTQTIAGDGWFSYKYNATNTGRDVSVWLDDGIRTFSVINQGTNLEVRINGTYQSDFPLDPTATIRIERVGSVVKIWQNTLLRYTSSAGASSTVADFKVSCGGDSTVVGLGINNAMISSAATGIVSISGRVALPSTLGVSRAIVQITDLSGNSRFAISNPFGYFHFANIPAGTYTFSIKAKNHSFSTFVQTLAQDNLGLNVTASN